MEYILYFSRFLYRIRYWLIIGTGVITLAVIFATANLRKTYNVDATLYTGVVSGYTIEGTGLTDWAATNNAIDNLVNIIRAESTLKRVSYRLYARNMINGDPERDNEFITAANFRAIYNLTKNSPDGEALLALIDKDSEEETVKNMLEYERPTPDNFIYGLFYWFHPHYSYDALQKITINRKGNSDLLQISYFSADPGIAFNTISILLEEFVNEYRAIRYGETDRVIEYFREELSRVGRELRLAEDSLTEYNIQKRVINYYDETKEIAAINKEFELREQDVLRVYNSSKAMLDEIEKRLDTNIQQLRTNAQFVNTLNKVSALTSRISELESFSTSSSDNDNQSLNEYRNELKVAQAELEGFSDQYIENLNTKEGLAKSTIVEQWLEQILLYEKAKAELEVVQKSRQELNDKYVFFAPVGSTIKRKERVIDFTERNYLTTLKSYNDALMRKKNLEMTSATLKVLNPPAYPISAQPTNRKKIIIAAFLASIIFIIGVFLLLEMLDQTLRDKMRAERITKGKVIGAFPGDPPHKYRDYDKQFRKRGTKYLSNTVLGFFEHKKEGYPYIVNFLSTEDGDGKTYLSKELQAYWEKLEMKVRRLSWETDFEIDKGKYLLAESISDICTLNNEDILIVEYPSLKGHNVPNKLLEEANLNLLVTRADRAWKDADKLIYTKLNEQIGNTPLYFYLNKTSMEATENFTGMLPPYTYLRKLSYKLSQLGLTESTSKVSTDDSE